MDLKLTAKEIIKITYDLVEKSDLFENLTFLRNLFFNESERDAILIKEDDGRKYIWCGMSFKSKIESIRIGLLFKVKQETIIKEVRIIVGSKNVEFVSKNGYQANGTKMDIKQLQGAFAAFSLTVIALGATKEPWLP